MSDLLKGLDAMAKDGWKWPKEAAAKIRELEAADEQSRQQYLIVSARAEAAEAKLAKVLEEVDRLQTVHEFTEHAASTWIDKYKELQDAIREHRDSFSKDMDEHDWTTEDEALWALVEEVSDE